jgi:hypothetical protein
MHLKMKFLELSLPKPYTIEECEGKVEVVEITFPQGWPAAHLRMGLM